MTSSTRWVEAAADVLSCSVLVPLDCPRELGPDARFTLLEVVGVSDRAWVYRAIDNKLSSEHFTASVAVKLINGPQRGKTEALLSRAVEHPHAVRVIDCGTVVEGFEYVVSEWMDGGHLGANSLPMPPREAAALIIRLAGAVQTAHSQGIIHCDIKPENVLMDRSGVPKLADFDLAYFSPLDDGSWRGTPPFMAPEQLLNAPGALTPQADVYGLGALLYWCLTGRPPHGSEEAVLRRAATEEWSVDVSGLPYTLGLIVERSLAPNRIRRYQSAYELACDLQSWLDHRPIAWQQLSLASRLKLLLSRRPLESFAAILLGSVLIGGGAVSMWLHQREVERQREADQKSIRLAIEALEKTRSDVRALMSRRYADLRSSVSSSKTPLTIEHIGPAMIFAQWLGASSVFDSKEGPVEASVRIELLERLIAQANKGEEDQGLAVLATRLALLDIFMQSRRYEDALNLLESSRASHSALLHADPLTAKWMRANELAARLGLEGESRIIGLVREQVTTELQELAKGLDGPYFSRAQRRQIEAQP